MQLRGYRRFQLDASPPAAAPETRPPRGFERLQEPSSALRELRELGLFDYMLPNMNAMRSTLLDGELAVMPSQVVQPGDGCCLGDC